LVARAGASTVAEVTAAGVPSVLVPLPGAPSDHQRHNAERLAGLGAAIVLDDAQCTPDRLAGIVDELGSDPAKLAAMGTAARSLGRRDAAARIAALVDDVAARRRPTGTTGAAAATGQEERG
ncbi:MAG: glycosyltransferase, partial [Acidimicrobiales bacterium]